MELLLGERPRRTLAGELIRGAGIVESGAIALSCVARSGRRATIAILGAGDLYGQVWGQESPIHDAAVEVRAIIDTTVLAVDCRSLAGAARSDPEVSSWLAERIQNRLLKVERRLEWALCLPVPERLFELLLDLADSHGVLTAAGRRIELPLTQETLAEMAGATRESVNRALRNAPLSHYVLRIEGRYVVAPGALRLEGGGS